MCVCSSQDYSSLLFVPDPTDQKCCHRHYLSLASCPSLLCLHLFHGTGVNMNICPSYPQNFWSSQDRLLIIFSTGWYTACFFDCAFERGKGVVRRKHSNPLITTSRSSYFLLTFHPQFSNPRKPTLLVHLTVHHYRPQLREKYPTRSEPQSRRMK